MQPEPIGFGRHIWGAQAAKTTIFFFFACCPIFYPSCFILCHPVFDVFAILFFSIYCFVYGVYSSRERRLGTMLFFHPASHSHLGAAHCNYSPVLRSHVQLQQSTRCFTYLSSIWRERDCYCYSFTFPKGPWRIQTGNLPVTNQCLKAIKILFSMKHLPCLQTTALGEKVSFFYDKFTRGKQIYSSATANDAKWCSQTQPTPLNSDHDVCPFSPVRTPWWMGSRAAPSSCLSSPCASEQGEMNRAVTSISAKYQIEPTSDHFSTNGECETALKMFSDGARRGEKSSLSAR